MAMLRNRRAHPKSAERADQSYSPHRLRILRRAFSAENRSKSSQTITFQMFMNEVSFAVSILNTYGEWALLNEPLIVDRLIKG
jgi:hypothetical protein